MSHNSSPFHAWERYEMHPFKVRYRPLSFSMANNHEELTKMKIFRLENQLEPGPGRIQFKK